MQLLLTAATDFELQPALDFLDSQRVKFPGTHIHVCIGGVGIASTTYSLTAEILQRRPDIVIQAGIAGTLTPTLLHAATPAVVAVSQDCFADAGVWQDQRWNDLFDLGLLNDHTFPYEERFLKNPWQHLLQHTGLPQVTGVTVQEITTQPQRIAWYEQNLPAFVESMEGAALHYVCLQQQVPFLQLRAVSNIIGERDKKNWRMKEAIISLNDTLIRTINTICNPDETDFRL
ncbi:futalosine hydrolase [Nostoc ellipsosporum NOK]|nr:futalosine hydrolase [Nostoc ellipsosporum NOK]